MLAPVLARLLKIPGVTSARVDSWGRYFWLTVPDLPGAGDVAALALGVLGEGARILGAGQAEAQLSAHRHGDPWLAADQVMTLSFVESRLLSVRIAGEVRQEAGVTPGRREEIAEAIRLELFAAMERVHAEGGRGTSGWIYEEWPAIAEAAARRCGLQATDLLPALRAR